MSKVFKGRPVVAGKATLDAVVSRQGVNTLATFQKSALAKKKQVICSDQNNKDIFNKNLTGMALCLPKTIGSTTGGMVLFTVSKMGIGPKAMLFSEPIDSLAAANYALAVCNVIFFAVKQNNYVIIAFVFYSYRGHTFTFLSLRLLCRPLQCQSSCRPEHS